MTRVAYFRSPDGGSNSPDDARALAYQACRDETEGKRLYDKIMGYPIIGMRESLIDDWRPRGAMELSLIDGLAQAFFQYQYWVTQSVLRTQTKPREPHPEFVRWWGWHKPGDALTAWPPAGWEIPFVTERNAVEQMADRWNRIYLRTFIAAN
jgi:hypothetical protein